MKTTKSNKSGSAKPSNKKQPKLYLVHDETKPPEPTKSRAGDMDMLERAAEKPLSPVLAQFDRSYKAVHSLFGWPLPIV